MPKPSRPSGAGLPVVSLTCITESFISGSQQCLTKPEIDCQEQRVNFTFTTMQKKLHFVLIPLLSLGATSFLAAPDPSPSPDQIAAESKRANEFLDKVFDEFVATHPQIE